MTTPTKRKAVVKPVPAKVPTSRAKAVAAVPEFVSALTDMANDLAAQRHRADELESQLAEAVSNKVIEEDLRADILEINRILNWYGGQRGWCSDYEHLQRLTNERLRQSKMLRRPGYGEGYRDHDELENDPDWKPFDW